MSYILGLYIYMICGFYIYIYIYQCFGQGSGGVDFHWFYIYNEWHGPSGVAVQLFKKN